MKKMWWGRHAQKFQSSGNLSVSLSQSVCLSLSYFCFSVFMFSLSLSLFAPFSTIAISQDCPTSPTSLSPFSFSILTLLLFSLFFLISLFCLSFCSSLSPSSLSQFFFIFLSFSLHLFSMPGILLRRHSKAWKEFFSSKFFPQKTFARILKKGLAAVIECEPDSGP